MAVDTYDGEISVEIEVWKATIFMFTLPVGKRHKEVKKAKSILKSYCTELIKEEKNIINLYICDLKELLIYETTEIEKILKKINASNSTDLQK